MSRQYRNAPVREAIFDVRVNFEKLPDQSTFQEFVEEFKKEYPKSETLKRGEFSFKMAAGEKPDFNSSSEDFGVRIFSKDGTKVIQFRKDGFSFSKLKPYCGWEDFSSEAKTLFRIYTNKCSGGTIERLALRYINAFEIPMDKFDMEDYFKTSPTLSPDIPQYMISFFMRTVVSDDETENVAIINQTVEETKREGMTTILFDLDVFRPNLKLPTDSSDVDVIFEGIKDFRTRLFEGSITDKARELIS